MTDVENEELTAEQLAAVAAEGDNDQSHEEEQQGAEPTEVEALALNMGWTREEDWRGDDGKPWVDAETFIRTGPEILKRTLAGQDRQLDETRKLLDDFKGFHSKVEERAYKRAKTDLQAEQRKAVEDGDAEAFDTVQTQIDELDEEARAPADVKDKPNVDPQFDAWKGRNTWFGDDIEMTVYAEQIAPIIGKKHQGAAFYEAADAEIRRKFPEKFSNQRRKRPASVEAAGGAGARRGNGQGYADLPADAKAACDRFIGEGMFKGPDGEVLPVDKARAKYVEQFDWSE